MAVELILLAVLWIENLDRLPIVVGGLAKVSVTLGRRRHRRERIVRMAAPRTVPSAEKEPFVAAVENLGNLQGPADVGAEPRMGHRVPDAAEHEPGGFVGHTKYPMQLMRAHPLLAGRKQVEGEQPLVQRNV